MFWHAAIQLIQSHWKRSWTATIFHPSSMGENKNLGLTAKDAYEKVKFSCRSTPVDRSIRVELFPTSVFHHRLSIPQCLLYGSIASPTQFCRGSAQCQSRSSASVPGVGWKLQDDWFCSEKNAMECSWHIDRFFLADCSAFRNLRLDLFILAHMKMAVVQKLLPNVIGIFVGNYFKTFWKAYINTPLFFIDEAHFPTFF